MQTRAEPGNKIETEVATSASGTDMFCRGLSRRDSDAATLESYVAAEHLIGSSASAGTWTQAVACQEESLCQRLPTNVAVSSLCALDAYEAVTFVHIS